MASKRKPATKTTPRKTPVKREAVTAVTTATGTLRWYWMASIAAAVASVVAAVAIFAPRTPRGVEPPAYPVVSLEDSPGVAMTKSHARYLLNWADALDEFGGKAKTFTESGDAAKWFSDRTAQVRKEAYADPGGFDAYVFGHAGGTTDGHDRYDAAALTAGAEEMAAACRADAMQLLNGITSP